MDDRERSELLERLSLEFTRLITADVRPYPGQPHYDGLPLTPQKRTWSKVRFYGFSPDLQDIADLCTGYGWVSKICGLRSDGRYFAVGVFLMNGFEFENPEASIRQYLRDGWEYFDSYRCCSCGLITKTMNSPCLIHGDSKAIKSVN